MTPKLEPERQVGVFWMKVEEEMKASSSTHTDVQIDGVRWSSHAHSTEIYRGPKI